MAMGNRFVFCLVILTQIPVSQSDAIVEVQFARFANPSEEKFNGQCCDHPFCDSDCEHILNFCIDSSRNTDHNSCSYRSYSTGSSTDSHTFNFGSFINGVPNPLVLSVNNQNFVVIKVLAIDNDDPLEADTVDRFYRELDFDRFGRNQAGAAWSSLELRGERSSNPTSLSIRYRGYCKPHYYGETCDTFCQPQDDDTRGHYTCDPLSGSRVCRYGWLFPSTNCVIPDPCIQGSNPCVNGGTCDEEDGEAKCTCRSGYVPPYCVHPDHCMSQPCANGGGCTNAEEVYSCSCLDPYIGSKCQLVDYCFDQPCVNNGTCENLADGYNCTCPIRFMGQNCETEDFCISEPCVNGGTCHNEESKYNCSCPEGYTGDTCALEDLCLSDPCENGATCSISLSDGSLGDVTCTCPPCYQGDRCQTDQCAVDTGTSPGCVDRDTCVQNGCQCQVADTTSQDQDIVSPDGQDTSPSPLSPLQGGSGQSPAPSVNQTNTTTIIAAVVPSLLVATLLVILIVLLLRKRRNSGKRPPPEADGFAMGGAAAVANQPSSHPKLSDDEHTYTEIDMVPVCGEYITTFADQPPQNLPVGNNYMTTSPKQPRQNHVPQGSDTHQGGIPDDGYVTVSEGSTTAESDQSHTAPVSESAATGDEYLLPVGNQAATDGDPSATSPKLIAMNTSGNVYTNGGYLSPAEVAQPQRETAATGDEYMLPAKNRAATGGDPSATSQKQIATFNAGDDNRAPLRQNTFTNEGYMSPGEISVFNLPDQTTPKGPAMAARDNLA